MPVITVLGDVEPESLGIIAPHEHILLDAWSSIVEKRILSEKREISKKNLYYQKVKMSNLGALKLDVAAVRDNLMLLDVDIAVEELMEDAGNIWLYNEPVSFGYRKEFKGIDFNTRGDIIFSNNKGIPWVTR